MKKSLSDHFPGILLLLISIIIGCCIYKDYGIAWDEPTQRSFGVLSYDFLFHHSNDLLTQGTDHHGAGFELLLVFFEKCLRLTVPRDIYLMRHLVTHIFFLISCFFGYLLFYRLFNNKWLAALGFVMIAFAPRLYAHSFFNSKDIPFLSVLLIAMAVCQLAFEKNKPLLFLITGVLCGFATSIRIPGLLFFGLVFLFLFADMVNTIVKKEKQGRALTNLLLFPAGFFLSLYLWWPYLWAHPIGNLVESYNAMIHFNHWGGYVIFKGKFFPGEQIPVSYLPTWFSITTPELWLMAGCCGFLWVLIDLVKRPGIYLTNAQERIFLFSVLNFSLPVAGVIGLHSVIYDDWRHLYFIYPFFVLLGLYFINKIRQTRYKVALQCLCGIQLALVGNFMIKDHPFQQVYFNGFVSHEKEYLHNNYDMEYWGCSYKQALDYIVAKDHRDTINIRWVMDPLRNNMLLLSEADQRRIRIVEFDPDYFITNFRNRPDFLPDKKVEYSISVLNSTILCVYKMR